MQLFIIQWYGVTSIVPHGTSVLLFSCSLILHIIVRCQPSVSSPEPNTIINLHSEHFCIIVIKCETKKQLLINFELPALAGC